MGATARRTFSRFLSISKGSLLEVETFLLLAIRLEYLSNANAANCLGLIVEIGKMLTALKKRLAGAS